MLAALVVSIGTSLWKERRNAAYNLEQKRRVLILTIEEKSSETDSILGQMVDAADLAFKSRVPPGTQRSLASVSAKFNELHFRLRERAWVWPDYIVEEARTHGLLKPSELA
jgi:hypothetical protein